jgi:hypothetical protein
LADAAPRIGAAAEPVDEQHQMQHNQIEAALNRIGHPVVAVKSRRARLRHDRAIELVDAAIQGMGAKEPPDHKVNRGRDNRLQRGRLPILRFGGTARGGFSQVRDEDAG